MVDMHIKQVRDQVPVYVAEGLILERQKTKEEMERMIAKAILLERGNIQAKISLQIQKAIDKQIPSQVDVSVRSYMSGHILHVHPVQSQTQSVPEQQYQLYLSMKNDPLLQQQDIAIWLALQMKFKNLQDDTHDDAHPEGENRANRQKTSEYEAYVSGESSSGQVNENEQDDDEIPTKQMSQDIMEEVSLTIDEAKLKKMVDEMLRQRCTSRDEHQYHIDQMKIFLKRNIVWESRKEILVSPHPRKTTPLVQSCQRDPEAPPLSLINQDLLYLKKGSSGPEKIVLSLHKFPAIIFNDDDIEERTSRWVNKCVKKFNPYARYGVEHWKNPHAKIFYIRKQKEPGKPKEIVARRANECIVSITEPDYKNLNKNDIEDMYLLIMNGKVPDYAETGLLWSLSVFIRSSVIWERVHDFQLGIESYQQKVNLTAPTISFPGVEKHKIVLEGLRSYNNDVKYGYIQRDLTNEEVEYLKLFEEEIEINKTYHLLRPKLLRSESPLLLVPFQAMLLSILGSQGKGIIVDDAAAPSSGVSQQRPSSEPAPLFRSSGDAIHKDFFPFSAGPYYATYPEDGVVGNGEMVRVEGLSYNQLTTKMSVLHCMMMLHGGELLARYHGLNQSHHKYVLSTDSRLKGYEEKVIGLTGQELQVSTLKKQGSGLNDKLSTSNASFVKSKAKGNERKKKIKSLSKSLDNFHSKVARLSAALNQATILEAERDEEILRLKATPPKFSSFFQGQFQGLVQKFLASDEFSRVQGELLSLAASAGFEHGLSMHQTKDEFADISKYAAEPLLVILLLEPEKLVRPANVPIPRDTRVSPPIAKESIVTPVSKSLELSTNVVPASSAIALE
ncbi:hypothetical protein Tco_0243216 [Tanacetum coccineum]